MRKLILLPLLFLSLLGSATNYYVKRTGSDAANGLSDATAWATPAKVTSSMSLFQPGDSILFKKGDSWTNALITIGKPGIAGKNIIISSYGSGARPVLTAQAGMPVIYITAANRGYWTVDDLEIRATTPPGGQAQSQGIYFAYWLSDLGAVPGWEIKNNKFNCSVHVSGPSTWIHHNTFAGDYNHYGYNKGGAIIIRGPEGDNCIIEHNTIYGWTDRAIWIMRGGSNPVIRYNTAYDIWGTNQTDHAGTGINIDGYGVAISGAKVYNNHVYNCTGLGLSLENAFGAEAYNNRFINCGWGGFSIYWYPEHQGKASNVNIHHNIVRNGAWGVLVNLASHWTIANNVFIKDDTGGATSDKNALFVSSPSTYVSNGTFANNIIAGNGYVNPVKLPDTKNIWTLFDYNIIVPAGTGIVNRGGAILTLSQVQALGFMTHGATADPKFVSPTSDWHLQSGSPAINSGINLGYTRDADGRSIDASPDMGAYEFAGIVAPTPQYVSSAIQNTSPAVIEMNYNLTLANIVPAVSAFTVMVNSVARTVSSVTISGPKVLLSLSSPVQSGNAVTISYTKPSVNPLQSTSGMQAPSIVTQTVTNNVTATSTSVPTYVSSVIQTLTPKVIEMTYNIPLANILPATSAFTVTVNSTARQVSAVTISGSKVLLTLPAELIYGDVVTVAYTRPASNPLQSTTGAAAANLIAQKVTNYVRAVPIYVSSVIQDATPSILEMSYNFPLENIVPSATAFSVSVNSTSRKVNSVAISGTKVLLTLDNAASKGDAVTVAYTKPSTNPIQIKSGGQASSLSPQPVTNNVTKTLAPAPVFVSAIILNTSPSVIEIKYDLSLANITPATSSYTVMVNSTSRAVTKVAVSGSMVYVTLSSPCAYGNVISVAYTKPVTNPLQTTAGGLAQNLSAQRVSNYIKALPSYVSSVIQIGSPSLLEMTYDFPLAPIVPAASSFRVVVNSVVRSVNSVSISGTKVFLRLASNVTPGNIVTVSYTKPAINPIQISSGGQAESISLKPVTNNTGGMTRSAVVTMVSHEPGEKHIDVFSGNAPSEQQILTVCSHSGEILIETKLESQKSEIPIELKKGIYIVNIISESVVIHVQKLIIM